METKARYAFIGVFTLAVVVAGFAFVYWLNSAGGLRQTASYRIRFETPVAGLLKGAAGLFIGDRILLWMERKGWIYYRSFEPRITGGVRGAMGTFQEIVEPQIREVKEEQSQRREARSDQESPSDG